MKFFEVEIEKRRTVILRGTLTIKAGSEKEAIGIAKDRCEWLRVWKATGEEREQIQVIEEAKQI